MSKETPIVLMTEKVTYQDMSERERQIYDIAYSRGVDAMKDVNIQIKRLEVFMAGMLLGVIAAAAFIIPLRHLP